VIFAALAARGHLAADPSLTLLDHFLTPATRWSSTSEVRIR
jgi:hypothetical protein